MSVQIVEPPPKRTSGRGPRYASEDLQGFADAVQSGQWVWDGEPAPTETAAYQRARSAIEHMCDAIGLDPITVKPRTYKDPDDEGPNPFRWLIGPRPESEQARIRAKAAEKAAEVQEAPSAVEAASA